MPLLFFIHYSSGGILMITFDGVKYQGTLSSGTKVTTASANEVYDLQLPNASMANMNANAHYLKVENFTGTAIHIKLNDESTIHEIDATTGIFEICGMVINSFVVQESGSSIRWTAYY